MLYLMILCGLFLLLKEIHISSLIDPVHFLIAAFHGKVFTYLMAS